MPFRECTPLDIQGVIRNASGNSCHSDLVPRAKGLLPVSVMANVSAAAGYEQVPATVYYVGT